MREPHESQPDPLGGAGAGSVARGRGRLPGAGIAGGEAAAEEAQVRITGTATFDSRTRTASGTVDWIEDGTCLPSNESGSCSIGTETPIEDSAGYEDGFVSKAPGGFEVDLMVDNTLIFTGTGCRGAVWGGPSESGGEYIEPHAFIAKNKIGQKTITAPITGSFSGSSEDGNQDGQMNGTLTLKRKGKR